MEAAVASISPGCLGCLQDNDGQIGSCVPEGTEMCSAADEDTVNAVWLDGLVPGPASDNGIARIQKEDLFGRLSTACVLAFEGEMIDEEVDLPQLFCAMPCRVRGPPLPPLTSCEEFTAAMATGGCAATCAGESGAYSAELFEAMTDFVCPAFMTVVSASAPVTVSDDQAALLVRRTQAFPLVICQWEPQVLAHTALIVWQANTESDEYRSFRSDFEDGVAGTMDGARSKACHRSVMSFSD